MNIVNRYLSSDDILVGLNVANKKQALEAVALLVERRYQVNHAPVLRALWRREQAGSTGLGHGIAIPHARIVGINEPIVLVVRTGLPIVFGAPDHQPVSVLFVILLPEHAHEEHLQILANVSEICADGAVRDRLQAAKEPAAIQHLFGESATNH